MQKGKQKEKSIAEEISIKCNNTYELFLEPHYSYGPFSIGKSMSDYKDCMKEDPARYVDWDPSEKRFVALNSEYEINLWFSKTGRLKTIAFYDHCFFQGNDLIGMNILKFLALISKEPDSVDVDFVPTKDENHGQHHRCYIFYFSHSKTLQLWTWRKRIKNIMLYDYSID